MFHSKVRQHALLGLRRPLVHGGAAQLPQLPDQQRLDLIGGFERAIGGVGEIEDALHSGQHLRLLAELPDELRFLSGELGTAEALLHPDFIGASGYICTFYSAEIFPFLAHF
jgi:hypothetical protein